MANYPLFREVMRAAVSGDAKRAGELDDQITDADRNAYNIYVTALFCGALEHRFATDQSQAAIKRFVDEMRYDYRNAQPPIQALVVEGLIRAVFGEDHLLDEISGEDQLRYQLLALRKIVDQSPEMKSRLDDYLSDAETLAAELQSEG
ncbi:hypothetical protein [Glycomyces tenuis]|uniref:hypothetical protein n=1 Tax=Glycomyces tenuis TaxID=58116 RepID=UPI00041BF263|nr:hypothetical protein [Glycomyces tenuis]